MGPKNTDFFSAYSASFLNFILCKQSALGAYLMNLNAVPKNTIVAYQESVGNQVCISLLCADIS